MKIIPTRLRQRLGSWLWACRGSKPWTRGYHSAKVAAIQRGIDGDFSLEELPDGYGLRIDERVIEYPWMFTRLHERPEKILDAGSVLNFEFILKNPKLSNKSLTIATLWPESQCFWHRKVSYVFDDLRSSCFRDQCFDVIVCMSTLEHIGMDNTFLYTQELEKCESRPETYIEAIVEFRRMLKVGGKLLLSVPFGAYRNHGWLQVFNSSMIEHVESVFRPSAANAWYFRYTQRGWSLSTKDACAGDTLFDFNRSTTYDSDFAASARAVVCLELVR